VLGASDGLKLGFVLGASDGLKVGIILGIALGFVLGASEGLKVGIILGIALGFVLGASEGLKVGIILGIALKLGTMLGLALGQLPQVPGHSTEASPRPQRTSGTSPIQSQSFPSLSLNK
jgi:hypothetical protein